LDKAILGDIHRFWFGELKSPDAFPREKTTLWFRQSEETDTYIRDHFGRYIPEAAGVDWDLASLAREEQVGLVVLFDQFPRNIFRTTGEAYAYDAKARDTSRRLIMAPGLDRFFWIERVSLLLPFEHSENIGDQDYSVLLSAELAVNAPPPILEFCRVMVDYTTKHRDMIRKFGRFPGRNAMLGRQSTPKEDEFLREHGRGF
jgi:uncharacterized protein (DUF924 family)